MCFVELNISYTALRKIVSFGIKGFLRIFEFLSGIYWASIYRSEVLYPQEGHGKGKLRTENSAQDAIHAKNYYFQASLLKISVRNSR